MGKRKFLDLAEVKTGMRIDQSIMDPTGRLLVARGTLLEGYHLEGLREINVNGLYIAEDETTYPKASEVKISEQISRLVREISVEDKPSVQLGENVKKQVLQGMQFLFSSPESDGFMDATNAVAGALMDALVENNAVAVDVNALKVCDEYTFKHSVDVASIAMIIAKSMGLGHDKIRDIGVSGMLHDLGKSKVPSDILNKPGRLTNEEFDIMKQHSVYGYELIKPKRELTSEIKVGVLQHHEKMSGGGYPLGVANEKIHMFGRILAVADIYDALVTERPYKSAFSPRDAVEMIVAMSGELDTDVIRAFLKSVILYPVGTTLQLSNGEYVKVVENVEGRPMRPKVVELMSGQLYDLANDTKCANMIIP